MNVAFVANTSHRLEIFRLIYGGTLVKNHTYAKSVAKGLRSLVMCSATLSFTQEKNHTCVISVGEVLVISAT